MLFFDLLGDAAPAVGFEVGPDFEDVDDSAALEGFVAGVEVGVVGVALFVEEVVGLGGVGVFHETYFLAEEEGGLLGDIEGFVGIPG